MTDTPRLPPRSGRAPTSLVLFLHGYGADANDLIDLGRAWAPALPETAFVSLPAPDRCPGTPQGRQWFTLQRRDQIEMQTGVGSARMALAAMIDAEARRAGVDHGAVALVGFSQGTMMALDAALTGGRRLAAVVGYSGLLADADAARAATAGSVPPILLIHGDRDEMIPVGALFGSANVLAAAGHPVEWHVSPGLGHGIAPDGLELGAAFLKRALAARGSRGTRAAL